MIKKIFLSILCGLFLTTGVHCVFAQFGGMGGGQSFGGMGKEGQSFGGMGGNSAQAPESAQNETYERQGYDLGDALEELNIPIEKQPEHLPGARQDPSDSKTKVERQNMGQPFIITYYIQKIATALTGLAAALAVLFIIQNTFNLLTSSGDSEIITTAKKGLMWSLIGLVLIMGSYIVVKTVISLPYAGEAAWIIQQVLI